MSWANATRPKEPDHDVFNLAHERAENLFPEKYGQMAKNHIPKGIASQLTSQSTASFRLHIKQARDLEGRCVDDVKKRAPVRVSMVTRRLKPIVELEPSDFWKVFWNINRCSYLPWKIGIAQGDFGLGNMMYDERDDQKFSVLYEYDLAAVTKPGDRCSSQSRWERTGTIPFITIDLLENPNGELKRWYRHDLEASAWCLAYHMLSERPREWLGHKFSAVANAKGLFLIKVAGKDYKEEWKLYTGFLHSWMRKWTDVQATLPSSLAGMPEDVLSAVRQQDEDTGDDTYIRTAILEARNIEALKFIEALDDTSWINVQLRAPVRVQ